VLRVRRDRRGALQEVKVAIDPRLDTAKEHLREILAGKGIVHE